MRHDDRRALITILSGVRGDATQASFINPYSFYLLRKYGLDVSTIPFYSDGFLLSTLLGLISRRHIQRISFDDTSLAPIVLRRASERRQNIFVVGSTPEHLRAFMTITKARYPGISIAGHSHGYVTGDELTHVIRVIVEYPPDVVIIGMGAGRQERFLLELQRSGYRGAAYTCGGYIHQVASAPTTAYYPRVVDRFNLRFLYRMIQEPYTIRRYALTYPYAIALLLVSYFRGRVVVA